MKKYTPLFLLAAFTGISLSILGAVVISAQTNIFSFERNLTIGSTGADVLELQKTLNLSPKTRLAVNGPGSPGEETTYFGPITRAAVIKYQDLYAKDILFPLGLSYGTGFFGPSTRAKLNLKPLIDSASINVPKDLTQKETTLKEDTTKTDNQVKSSSISIFSIEVDSIVLMYPSQYDGEPGDQITLYGLGFDPSGNTIRFGNHSIFNTPSLDGSQLTFAIPEVNPGRYNISVSASKGISESVYFQVVEKNAIKPIISHISPEFGVGATKVTIFGSGFKPTGNTIYTGYGVIENAISIDGTTIVVEVSLPFEQGAIPKEFERVPFDVEAAKKEGLVFDFASDSKASFSLQLYVENTNGLSNKATFNYVYDYETMYADIASQL